MDLGAERCSIFGRCHVVFGPSIGIGSSCSNLVAHCEESTSWR